MSTGLGAFRSPNTRIQSAAMAAARFAQRYAANGKQPPFGTWSKFRRDLVALLSEFQDEGDEVLGAAFRAIDALDACRCKDHGDLVIALRKDGAM